MEIILCCNCKEEKPATDFYRKRTEDRYSSYCRKCLYAYQHERCINRKRKAVQLLGGKCSKCGYNKCLSALEFHHEADKEIGITTALKRSWSSTVKELQKCVLLCSNCHKEEHASIRFFDLIPHRDNPSLNDTRIIAPKHVRSSSFDEKPKIQPRIIKATKCCTCENETFGTKYCSTQCASIARRKTTRPSPEELARDMKLMSWVALGRKHGVTDNGVRKWAKLYGLI